MFYKPKNFKVEELVPPEVFSKFKENSLMFFSPGLLQTLDELRKIFGPAIINNWLWEKKNPFTQRGLRTQIINGTSFSPHLFGRAFDISFANITAEEARRYIKKNEFIPSLKHIRRIENNVTWLHVDEFNVNYNGIYFFNP